MSCSSSPVSRSRAMATVGRGSFKLNQHTIHVTLNNVCAVHNFVYTCTVYSPCSILLLFLFMFALSQLLRNIIINVRACVQITMTSLRAR